MNVHELSGRGQATGMTRKRRNWRPIGLALAGALLAGALPVASAAAATPAHGGTFECYYTSAGARVVKAHLPSMKSNTTGEQVYWYAAVYKQTTSGPALVGYTRGSNLATGWANQNGLVSGALVPGYKWVDNSTFNGLIHGGWLAVSSPGTYLVGGFYWWSSSSTGWTGKYATYWNNPASTTCRFGS